MFKVSYHGHDIFADPALVGDIIDQIADQMNSYAANCTILN